MNALEANGLGASVMHGVRGDVRRAGGVKDMRRFESRYRRSYGSQNCCFLYVYRLSLREPGGRRGGNQADVTSWGGIRRAPLLDTFGEVFLEVSGVLNEGTEVWIYVRRRMSCDGGIVSAGECFPRWVCVQSWPHSLQVGGVCWCELY